MEDNTKGVIYILTNQSFPEWVKVGYSNNYEKRIVDLNNSTATPFSFHFYAGYKTYKACGDKVLHRILDKLNPKLRSIETNSEGKITRTREFYFAKPEFIYGILSDIAEISGTQQNLIKPEAYSIEEEIEADITKVVRDGGNIDVTKFLSEQKNNSLVELYKNLVIRFKESKHDIYESATKSYIALKNSNGRNICEIQILSNYISIYTRIPTSIDLQIGEKLSDSYRWSLNYRVKLNSNNELDSIILLLNDAYNQSK